MIHFQGVYAIDLHKNNYEEEYKNMIQFIYPWLLIIFISCYAGDEPSSTSQIDNPSPDYVVNDMLDNYHTDADYKYEYRTGTLGNYEYSYDISGTDQEGNFVNGNVVMNGKYGSGYIEDEEGNEKYLDVEWVDYGLLEGTDEDGNTYDLEVEE